MLGDDAFHHRNGDPLVPGSLRVDHGDGPALTNTEAVNLASQHLSPPGRHRERVKTGLATPGGRSGSEVELLEPGLQITPDLSGLLIRGTLRRLLLGAEKQVTLDRTNR
jgi:hypothetical protein